MRQRARQHEGQGEHAATDIGQVGKAQADGDWCGDDVELLVGIGADQIGIAIDVGGTRLEISVSEGRELRMKVGPQAQVIDLTFGDDIGSGEYRWWLGWLIRGE